MKKKFVLMFLAVCLLWAMTAGSALATDTVTDITVTMSELQLGKDLPRDAKVTYPANVTVTDIKWYDGGRGEAKNTKVTEGKGYVVYITVAIAPGADAKFGAKYELNPTINGVEAAMNGNPGETVTFWTNFYFEKPKEAPAPVVAPTTENYDTFDYRAYANVYPDVKAAYGYNAEKLWAHYVNYGKAEGRVGTFISGSNPKTNAPTEAPKADARFATLLDPTPPTEFSQQPNWSQNQCVSVYDMSNLRLVAEYWATQAQQDLAIALEEARLAGGPYDHREHWRNDTVQAAANAVREELSARVSAIKGESNIFADEGTYERAMASDTTILTQFRDLRAGNFPTPPANPGKPGQKPAATVGGFGDVLETDFFASPVAWAVEKKITGGTSKTTFSPNDKCTQAEILTFLWRAKGSPEPAGTVEATGFDGTEFYYKAALWAAEQDIIEGDFDPDTLCTRAMAVTYMWKQAGSPSAAAASFTDVAANAAYAPAVAWAVEKGVTGGTTPTTFAPDQTCTRGEIVTFLYRAFGK